MTWIPSGASEGSESVGIVASRYGCSEIRPYFESSNARSRSSRLGAMTIRPRRRSSSTPPIAGKPSRPGGTFATPPGRTALQEEGPLPPHAGRADVLAPPAQSRADLSRIDEAQKGLLGVGV